MRRKHLSLKIKTDFIASSQQMESVCISLFQINFFFFLQSITVAHWELGALPRDTPACRPEGSDDEWLSLLTYCDAKGKDTQTDTGIGRKKKSLWFYSWGSTPVHRVSLPHSAASSRFNKGSLSETLRASEHQITELRDREWEDSVDQHKWPKKWFSLASKAAAIQSRGWWEY